METIALAGSTALVLFAIRFLRKGIDRLLGTRPGIAVSALATSPSRGLLAGATLAAVAPSSSSMATVVSRLSLEDRIAPATALGLMLGANVGVTSLVLLGAAGIESWYPLPIAAGVALFQFTRSAVSRGVGQVVLSMGFVFLGLHLTKAAVPGLAGGDMDVLLGLAGNHPVVLAAASALLTVLLQSSSVTILLLMCVADRHPLGQGAILAAVAGANLGLVGTAAAIAWRDHRSRLVALGNAVFKGSVSVAAVIASIPWSLAPVTGGGDARSAALTHLCLALAAAAAGLCAGGPVLGWLSRRILATRTGNEPDTRFLRLETGGDIRLAMANSQREILRASETVRTMLEQVWRAWTTGDRLLAKEIGRLDDRIDQLDRAIKDHLARIGDDGDPGTERERLCQLRYVTQLEAIGDLIEKQIAELVCKGIRFAPGMPAECRVRLDTVCETVHRTLLTAETAFATRDPDLARRLTAVRQEVSDLVDAERDRGLWRRRSGIGHEADAIYVDLLAGLERINRCACTVGRDILTRDAGERRAV